MLEGYIDFVTSLFSSISPYTQAAAKESLRQFYREGTRAELFMAKPFGDLNQGDILSGVVFRYYDEDGQEVEQTLDVIVVSNSCDIENDSHMLVAPLFPLAALELDRTAMVNNRYYRLLYFPDPALENSIADLGLITAYPKAPVLRQMEQGIIAKKLSLNLVGFYLLISKLTVHFLRPEDAGVQLGRAG